MNNNEETTLNTTTLDNLRQLAADNRDGAGSALIPAEAAYFLSMLARIDDGPEGCWLWSGTMRGASPLATHRGESKMVRRSMWRLATGKEPGAYTVVSRCRVKRCVRPDPRHATLTRSNKGGGGGALGAWRDSSQAKLENQSKPDATHVACLADTIHDAARQLRECGVPVSVSIG